MEIEHVYIGLGSNLGNRLSNLTRALSLLARDPRITLQKVSPLYRSAPIQVKPQPDFLNAVASVRTSMGPRELLDCLKGVEQKLGRTHKGKDIPRIVDLDILEYGQIHVQDDELEIPHPRMKNRKFVLRPLADISPEHVLVANGQPLKGMLEHQDIATQRVEKWKGPDLQGLLRKYGKN